MIVGCAPEVIGQFGIDCDELMFVQYMPIRMPGCGGIRVPKNLQCFDPLLDAIGETYGWTPHDYIYLTAKKTFVSPGSMANRPGWHLDGFGTNDINFIWADCVPTEFCIQHFEVSDDHDLALLELEEQAKPENIRTFPSGSLIKLDQTVAHRVAECYEPQYRTFVKISISKQKYNLKGNAHNYLFDYEWPMVERKLTRNHPIGATANQQGAD